MLKGRVSEQIKQTTSVFHEVDDRLTPARIAARVKEVPAITGPIKERLVVIDLNKKDFSIGKAKKRNNSIQS